MDLLLYLLKRDEVDIYDIPIARITDSYMQYLTMLKGMKNEAEFDINVAGEFLVMAATLMEIKSAMLLPRMPVEEGQESTAAAELADPRYELVQKLLEYKRFKDSAMALDRQHQTYQSRFPRVPAQREGTGDEPPPLDMDEVQVWDLLEAFNRLMKEVGIRKPRAHEVIYDDTPIDLHAADIEDRLAREGPISFRALLLGRQSRSEMVGVFLALLELVRQKKVLIEGGESEGDLRILPAPEEHRRTGEAFTMHLATDVEGPAPANPAEPAPTDPGPAPEPQAEIAEDADAPAPDNQSSTGSV